MKMKKIIGALIVASLSTALFVGCGGKGSDGATTKGVVNLPTGAVKTLDSVKSTDAESFNVIQNTQETLLVDNNDKPEPGAAESFEVSKDGKTYTFKLRDGLKWSDGKELTSKDFKYAWLRLLDPKVAASYSFFLFDVVNAKDYFDGKAKAEDVGIKTPDDKTIVVQLNNPLPYFDQLVAFPGLSPEREDVVKEQGDKYGTDPSKLVYSGPFVVSNWQRGSKLELKKNPNYWNSDNTKLDTVNLLEVKETNTIYQMFTNNQLDAMGGTGEYLAKLEEGAKSGKWNEVNGEAASVFYTQFNFGKGANEALKSPKVRLAISLAVNREGFTKDVLKRDVPAYGLVPQGIYCGKTDYRDDVKQPLEEVKDKDPKKLFVEGLKDLGLDQDPSKYTFKYLLQGSDSTSKTQGEYMQNNWKKTLGINVELVTSADFSDFLTKQENGEFDFASSGWGADYNDPMTFLDLFGKDNGNNSGKYNDAKVNNLLNKLQNETNMDKRLQMYKEIEEIEVVGDPAVAPTYFREKYSFQKKNLKGLQLPNFGGAYQLRWTSIEK